MLNIIFQYGWEPVLILRILISFEAILKNMWQNFVDIFVRNLRFWCERALWCDITCTKYIQLSNNQNWKLLLQHQNPNYLRFSEPKRLVLRIFRDKTMADILLHKITFLQITISGWNVLTLILMNQQIKIE